MSRMSEKMRAVDAASKKAIAALKEACAAPPEDEAAAWEAAFNEAPAAFQADLDAAIDALK